MADSSITDLPDIDQFFHAYGKALAQWAGVEFRLCAWFERAAGLTIGRAEAIFFSGRSFQTRSEMLAAAIKRGKLSGGWANFANAALATAITYDNFRNQLAHGQLEPEIFSSSQSDRWRLRHPRNWREPGGIDREGLLTAAANFEALAEILRDAAWLELRGPPCQELLLRLAALPAQADSKSPSRKQRGRERQRQSVLRSKKSSK